MEVPLILAVETAGLRGGLALYEQGLLGEISFYAQQSYSNIILEYLPKLLTQTKKKLEDITFVAVDIGPGSFTGLRVGLSIVKALSLVYDFPILPVVSLECLAFRFWGIPLPIVSLIDAHTQEVYVGVYRFTPQEVSVLRGPELTPYQRLPKLIREKSLFVSESLEKWEDFLTRELGDLFLKPPFKVSMRASLLSELALLKWQKGEINPIKAEELLPLYLKVSEAERKKCLSI